MDLVVSAPARLVTRSIGAALSSGVSPQRFFTAQSAMVSTAPGAGGSWATPRGGPPVYEMVSSASPWTWRTEIGAEAAHFFWFLYVPPASETTAANLSAWSQA